MELRTESGSTWDDFKSGIEACAVSEIIEPVFFRREARVFFECGDEMAFAAEIQEGGNFRGGVLREDQKIF